ncbi:MAG: TerB family tellurite resistance protein [Myxococcales bacterium]|nr:TerB family tellurite resistance protein [Myxococcales bacterium]
MASLALSTEQATAGLRALVTVAGADGERSTPELRFIETAAKALRLDGVDVSALTPIEPDELGRVLETRAHRELAIQAMILTTLLDGHATEDEAGEVERFARALDVDEPRVKNLRQLAEGHTRVMWLDLARRSFARPIFERALAANGLRGVWKIVGPMIGLAKDPDLARRYNDLGKLPEGTLGRAYWEFIVLNELGFPGEGVVAEDGVWHDMTHVLAGYGTDPDGEVQVVSFIAGYRREDPFFWLFTIALQFHLAIKVSPYSEGRTGHFDPPMVLRALERGAALRRDLSDGWDYWPELSRPLDDVRRDLGVPPP